MKKYTRVQREKIAMINDIFRQYLLGGKIEFSQEVKGLEPRLVRELLSRIRTGRSTNKESSKGRIMIEGILFRWAIEYYDRDNPEHPANDPSDAGNTLRKLIITREE